MTGYQYIHTQGLPGQENPSQLYTFELDFRQSPVIVYIPANTHGPDKSTPIFPEQETWLNSLTDLMVQTWDCQWTLRDDQSRDLFLDLLKQRELL